MKKKTLNILAFLIIVGGGFFLINTKKARAEAAQQCKYAMALKCTNVGDNTVCCGYCRSNGHITGCSSSPGNIVGG